MNKVESASIAYIKRKMEERRRERDIHRREEEERINKNRINIERQKEFLFFSIVQRVKGDVVEWYYEPICDNEFSDYKNASVEILNENNSFIEEHMPITCRLYFNGRLKASECGDYRIYSPNAGVISFKKNIIEPGSLMLKLVKNWSAMELYKDQCRRRDEEYLQYKHELELEEQEKAKKIEQILFSRSSLISTTESGKRSRYIPQSVVGEVFHRDCCRCVICGSTENLQLDHIIPFSEGGANTVENLQVLCQRCNLKKSNKI